MSTNDNNKRLPTSEQLNNWSEQQKNKNNSTEILTHSNGAPSDSVTTSLSAGKNGPLLLSDFNLIDHVSHFDRERIPERVVHAKGAGAFGYFEVTHDISRYCRAKLFSQVGKRTPVAVRFSTVGGESGSADTARDPRGFAVKFYTEEGNWDLVGNNTPIFFIRDPILFPSFIHTQKRNPQTHLKDADMFWDFISLRPETTHQVSFLFSDRGTPDGYRFMNGYGSHTFKLVNSQSEAIYVKFHFKSNQGIRNLSAERAGQLAGEDPDYSIRDLFNSIEQSNFPSWNVKIQIMTFDQAEKYRWNPFDVTKVWPQSEFPLIPVGVMTLNRNPTNYFAEVEQIAFAPSHLVPGIEPSPDKMLQGRLFSYPDTHRHRLGTNYQQIPVNCPYAARVRNYQRDGPATIDNQGSSPNYFPNSFSGPQQTPSATWHQYPVSGDVARYNTADDDNFSQVSIFWNKVLNDQEKTRLVNNIANHLKNAKLEIQQRAIANFTKADSNYGRRIQEQLDTIRAQTSQPRL
eukprot:TRINITY_DN2014_c0_g2_i1.p1 TRINITY_DN2014_c0_g2~~TRINITY_DN2014_c0_g2_i1.p1  ORF type:complete len:515 (+),score=269.41 TRINITY_DN2014_c0_g2_i1:44-1588(+)